MTPSPLPDFDPLAVVDLDVREDLRAGREPLARITAAASALAAGSVLHLRTPFQPTPLFGVLARLGFRFHAEPFADDDWSSWFWRDEPTRSPRGLAGSDALPVEGAWDLRDLLPPEPLHLVLERLDLGRDPFDVLLPASSDLLFSLIAQRGWRPQVVAESGSSVRVRLTCVTKGEA